MDSFQKRERNRRSQQRRLDKVDKRRQRADDKKHGRPLIDTGADSASGSDAPVSSDAARPMPVSQNTKVTNTTSTTSPQKEPRP